MTIDTTQICKGELYAILFELRMSVRIAMNRIVVFAKVPFRVNDVQMANLPFRGSTTEDAIREAFRFMLGQNPNRDWKTFQEDYKINRMIDSPTYRRLVSRYTSCACQDCINDSSAVDFKPHEDLPCWTCCYLVINDTDSYEYFYEREES